LSFIDIYGCLAAFNMKLSEWAKRNGLSYRTAWKLFKDGNLPVPAQQLKTGTILISEEVDEPKKSNEVVLYCRISSRDQKNNLDSQVARLCQYAISRGWVISEVVTEIGSGLNGNRKKLIELLKDKKVQLILAEHRDRVTRFGFELIEATLESAGRSIVIMEDNELPGDKKDLVRDMIDVLTSFCARLYGRRSAENRAKKAVKFLEEDHGNHDSG
jgi:putative resolvase